MQPTDEMLDSIGAKRDTIKVSGCHLCRGSGIVGGHVCPCQFGRIDTTRETILVHHTKRTWTIELTPERRRALLHLLLSFCKE